MEWLRRITQGIVLLIWAAAWAVSLWRSACYGEPLGVPLMLNIIFALALGIVSGKDLVKLLPFRRRRNNG